jgi:hypothetical protein
VLHAGTHNTRMLLRQLVGYFRYGEPGKRQKPLIGIYTCIGLHWSETQLVCHSIHILFFFKGRYVSFGHHKNFWCMLAFSVCRQGSGVGKSMLQTCAMAPIVRCCDPFDCFGHVLAAEPCRYLLVDREHTDGLSTHISIWLGLFQDW